jgi:transposase, IS30 family
MAYHQLTREERYLIAWGLRTGLTLRGVSRALQRAPSTVSREVGRNATRHDGAYRTEKAESYAVARRRRSRRGSQYSEAVFSQVDTAIRQRWSAEQIVGRFRSEGRVVPSHETIYRRLRRDKREGGTLHRFTRILSKYGRKRYRSRPTRGVLLGKRHIGERGEVVERRGRIGDWELDTVMGTVNTRACVLTMVERRSGFTMIRRLKARTAAEVTAEATKAIQGRRENFRTLTFDNGTEFHDYETLEREFGVICYFATPYHSWERGTNENLNGLLRQYLPKGQSMENVTQARCNSIAALLNSRPRKRHDFKTPNEVILGSDEGVALVG